MEEGHGEGRWGIYSRLRSGSGFLCLSFLERYHLTGILRLLRLLFLWTLVASCGWSTYIGVEHILAKSMHLTLHIIYQGPRLFTLSSRSMPMLANIWHIATLPKLSRLVFCPKGFPSAIKPFLLMGGDVYDALPSCLCGSSHTCSLRPGNAFGLQARASWHDGRGQICGRSPGCTLYRPDAELCYRRWQ